MKYSISATLVLLLVLAALPVSGQAQDGACTIDMQPVNDLLALAQLQTAGGDLEAAQASLEVAREALQAALAECGLEADLTPPVRTSPSQGGKPPVSDFMLSQTVSSEDLNGNILEISYPADWVAQEDMGVITLANAQDVLENEDGPEPGQIGGVVLFLPEDETLLFTQSSEPATAVSVLSGFVGLFFADPTFGDADLSDPAAFVTTGGRDAAVSSGSIPLDNGIMDGFLVAVDLETGFALLVFFCASGEMAAYEPLILAMAGSLRLNAGGDM